MRRLHSLTPADHLALGRDLAWPGLAGGCRRGESRTRIVPKPATGRYQVEIPAKDLIAQRLRRPQAGPKP